MNLMVQRCNASGEDAGAAVLPAVQSCCFEVVRVVTGAGIEPAARALKVRCSATELPGLAEEAVIVLR